MFDFYFTGKKVWDVRCVPNVSQALTLKVPNQPKNFHTKSSQTRKREERNIECQTNFQIEAATAKSIIDTVSLIEAETQTENFDSLKSLRRYRKRNRQLEIVYENTGIGF